MHLMSISLVLFLLLAPRCADAINNGAFITAPPSLAGALRFEPAMFGPMPPAANLTAQIAINLVDPCIWNASADASSNYTLPASVSGKIVLFQMTSALTCSFGFLVAQMQARGAAGVIFPINSQSTLEAYIVESSPIALYTRDPPFPVASFQIPVMSIGIADSEAIKAVLLSNTVVTLNWLGSGPAQPAQKAALASLYQTMTSNGNAPWTFGGYKTGVATDLSGDLQPWSLLLTNASYDPCTSRAYGIWCIGGNIVLLYCPNCGISGAVPAVIGQLVHVQKIHMSANAISGALPCEVGLLTKLRVASFEKNQISSLSTCFGQLTQMEYLAVGQNTHLAALPAQLSSFTSLVHLTAGKNALTSVPDLSLLTGLIVIDLNSNQIAQPIMSSFAAFTKLQSLDLHGNMYTGSLSPSAFDSLPYLTSVHLGFNKLEGSLPDFYMNGTAGSITSIDFAYNSFSGTVPLRWRFLQNLVSCSLAHNTLSSPVRPFLFIPYLQTLDLSFNNLTLTSIDSAGRKLVGNLGPFLRFSVPHDISSILLNNNRLSGVFSPGWATFPRITVISVANNQLSGSLPVDLWTDFNAARTIQRFDLSGNLWVAPLPPGAPPNCLHEIDLSNCPLLANAVTSIPSFLQASSELILDRSATFSCPRLVNMDIAGSYKFFVDPSFYQYATCTCQRGFTSGGVPPNCLQFPQKIAIGSSSSAGVFSDGSSAGRLRQGVDSEWAISPTQGPLGVITLTLTMFPPQNGSNYQISVFPSGSISTTPLLFTASNLLAETDFATRTFATRRISVISSTVLLHLVSNADAGPIFNASFVTSSSCPGDLIADRKTSVCMPRSAFNVAILSTGTQKLFLALAAALLVYTLLNSLLIIRFWKHQIMHAASPLIMLVFTLGVLLVLSASLMYTRTMTAELCEAHVWLVNVGFSITYGSIFAKTWRLHKIFNSTTLQVQVIPDWKLLAAVGLLVVFDLVAMGIWRIVSPWSLLENPLGACSAGPYGGYFEIILLAQKGALTVGGSVLIYLVKSLPVKFNESKHLAGTLYNTLLVSIVYISVVLGLGEQLSPSSRTIMSSALTIYGAACAVVLVTGPKLLRIFSDSKASDEFVALDDDGQQSAPSKAKAAAAAPGKVGTVESIETRRLALRNEYDAQCRKLKTTEEQLEKQRARIQELRAAMIDTDQELSHAHAHAGAASRILTSSAAASDPHHADDAQTQSPPSSELHSQIELLT